MAAERVAQHDEVLRRRRHHRRHRPQGVEGLEAPAQLLVAGDRGGLQVGELLQGLRAAGAPEARRHRAQVRLGRALARKQRAVFAYVAALPALADPDARVAVMQILASEAEHIAALRQSAGQTPVADAFAGFMEPA